MTSLRLFDLKLLFDICLLRLTNKLLYIVISIVSLIFILQDTHYTHSNNVVNEMYPLSRKYRNSEWFKSSLLLLDWRNILSKTIARRLKLEISFTLFIR